MNTTPLSRVEVWQIENVLFKLYRIIQSCVDFIDPDNIGIYELASPITWIDKDTIITEFFEKPQYYEYGEDSAVTLSGDNLFRLRNYIIENQALGVAIDLTEQELNLHSFILFLKNLDEPIYSCLGSIQYLEMLRDFRYEIYKWACFYSNSIGSTIDDEMTKRQEATYLIAENLNELHLKYRPQQKSFILHSDSDDEDAFDLSDYFKSHYDKAKILKIYKQISVLAYEQEDLYISKIISLIACAHYRDLLRCSYAKTIKATLAKFHIEVKKNYLHPATFGQPTEKGRLREACQEAVAFYDAL